MPCSLLYFQCCKVTGDDRLSAEDLKRRIKSDKFYIFVVTPDIIKNYFHSSREASMSDFTLLIFDEVHHTKKKHTYNYLLKMYRTAVLNKPQVSCISVITVKTSTIIVDRSKTSNSPLIHGLCRAWAW